MSDIALKQPLPVEVVHDVQAYVGCIAGAIQISEYERLLREAGFEAVVVQDTGANLERLRPSGTKRLLFVGAVLHSCGHDKAGFDRA